MIAINCRRLAVRSAILCLVGWGATAHADWAACQSKPTRSCVLEEALRGDSGPLAGKDRLDVLMQAGAFDHVEYATAADVDEALRQAKSTPSRYANFAIRALIAEDQKQQAADLVASIRGVMQDAAFIELTRALAKTGDLDTAVALLDRMAPTLDPSKRSFLSDMRIIESVKALAEAGKIEDALPLVMSRADLPEFYIVEMQMAVAQAYADRGDTRMAQRYFDLVGQTIKKAEPYAVGAGPEELRFESISLSALRGDTEAVRTALQQLPTPQAGLPPFYRSQGYQRVVNSLLKAKQFPLALEVARSAPDPARDWALYAVNAAAASNGRIDDAREALASFGDKVDPTVRAAAVRNVAVALVRAGKLAPAIEMAAQVNDPVHRKGFLFAIAQAMPQ